MKSFILLFTLIFNFSIYSQWQQDVRLTNEGSQSYLSGNRKHCIASGGNILHVVWYDQRSNWDIYYKRSSDSGETWSADTRLSNGSGESHEASIAVSGSFVHVVYQDNRDGHWEIYYIRSTDSGINWGAETRITALDTYDSGNPVISISGSILHVAWDEARDGNVEIYYKNSTNNGINWGTDIRLTNNAASSNFCSITSYTSFVHVVWFDNRDGNLEVYYKRSTDAGLSWGADTRLSDLSFNSDIPFIEVSEAIVIVTWMDARDGNNEIYYKRSSDSGINWSTDIRLTNNIAESSSPNMTTSGSNVHLTWQDNRDGNFEVYYRRSTDRGISWGSETRLTNAGGNSLRTFTAVSGTSVNLVFMDERNGNWEIYYKQDPTGNPVTQTPPAPNLVSPTNGATIYTTTPMLDWDSLSSANYYRVQIATDSLFTYILFDTIGLINSNCTVPVGELSPGSTCFWRVRATNSAGNGPWSIIWRFFAATTPPVPNLAAPPNGSYNQPSTVRFIWNRSVGTLTYRLQVSLDSLFTNFVVNDSTLTDSTIVVTNLNTNRYYWWRVNAKNPMGTSPFSVVWKFGTFLVGLNQINAEIPKEFKLYNNYPNPFNPVTKLRFEIPIEGNVIFSVYDILGREIYTFNESNVSPGTYEYQFDGSNFPSGIYLYRLNSGNFNETKKLLLIK